MDALMYGMMPKAAIAPLVSAPPVNMLYRPIRLPAPLAAPLAGMAGLAHVAADYRIWAPDMEEIVRKNRVSLAAVEAMQSCALLWSMLMGVGFLGEPWPQGIAALGAVAVFGGIVMFTALSALRR